MQMLRSYVEGRWVEGKEPLATLVNPATEEPLARTSTAGIDFGAALEFGRTQGGPALRELTFAQRGELLKAWSKALYAARDELLGLALQNGGNTRGDAKFDVDGAIGSSVDGFTSVANGSRPSTHLSCTKLFKVFIGPDSAWCWKAACAPPKRAPEAAATTSAASPRARTRPR